MMMTQKTFRGLSVDLSHRHIPSYKFERFASFRPCSSPPLSSMDHSQNYPSEFSTAARDGEDVSQESTLAGVSAIVEQLEADHRSKGTKLSGRIIHVTHYLPIVTTL